MPWWFLAIPVAAALKFGYDCLTDDDSSSSDSGDYARHLAAQKGLRTKYRKTLLHEIITKQTQSCFGQIEDIVVEDESSLGTTQLKKISSNSGVISHKGVDQAIGSLASAFEGKKPKGEDCSFSLSTCDLDVKSLIKKANEKYGAYAGLDDNENYVPNTDPFVSHLEKILKGLS